MRIYAEKKNMHYLLDTYDFRINKDLKNIKIFVNFLRKDPSLFKNIMVFNSSFDYIK